MTKEIFIKDVMVKPTTIAKSAKITEALDKMLAEDIDPLIAINNNSVVGTVSRQAIAEKLGSKQNSDIAPTAIHVASVVEEDFTSVYPDESINVLIPLLQRYKLIVVYDEDHNLIGQVSAGDLLKKCQPDDGIVGAIEKVITIEADERVDALVEHLIERFSDLCRFCNCRWLYHYVFDKNFFCHFATSFMISSRFIIPDIAPFTMTTRLLTWFFLISSSASGSSVSEGTVITGLVITSSAITGARVRRL